MYVLLPLIKGTQGCQPISYCLNLHFVQATSRFLPITGDKRDGIAFIEQRDRSRDLFTLDIQFEAQCLGDI
jgi:hypothetical protein